MNSTEKIPKKIHYFWFGRKSHNKLIRNCIASWKKYLPDYEIIEWNEDSYNIEKNEFTEKAFTEKKWAFLSDYARLDVLNEYGGIYLDTDMEVLKPLDDLLENKLFMGMESEEHVNGSIIGSESQNWYIKEVLAEYNLLEQYETIPKIMTRVLNRHCMVKNIEMHCRDLHIYPTEYFYPFGFEQNFTADCVTENTYTIHWWSNSWGDTHLKVLRKLGLLKIAVTIKKKLKLFF